MVGGPGQMDTFDPKPALERYAGQGVPESFGAIMTRRDVAQNPLLPAIAPFERCGQSGLEISSLHAQLGKRSFSGSNRLVHTLIEPAGQYPAPAEREQSLLDGCVLGCGP